MRKILLLLQESARRLPLSLQHAEHASLSTTLRRDPTAIANCTRPSDDDDPRALDNIKKVWQTIFIPVIERGDFVGQYHHGALECEESRRNQDRKGKGSASSWVCLHVGNESGRRKHWFEYRRGGRLFCWCVQLVLFDDGFSSSEADSAGSFLVLLDYHYRSGIPCLLNYFLNFLDPTSLSSSPLILPMSSFA